MNDLNDKLNDVGLTLIDVYPGSNQNISGDELQNEILKVLASVESGNFEYVNLLGEQ